MVEFDLRVPIHHPQPASRVFSGEAVIITPAENMVRMLNPVSSRIWELADGTRTVEKIAQALTEEFEVDLDEARASAAAFVDELATKGL
ncbi:MAG: PqqD family protein [Anaerolineae bacterium]